MSRRLALYGTAAAVSLWSAWLTLGPQREPAAASIADATRPRAALPPAPAASTSSVSVVAPGPLSGVVSSASPRLAPDGSADAFAARNWLPPPPPPPPPAPAPPPPPPAVPPPPPPPTLPYRFVGLLDEGPSAPTRAFLALGDRLIVAGAGDQLDGGFKLVSIGGHELVFNHLQTNTALRLSVTQGKP